MDVDASVSSSANAIPAALRSELEPHTGTLPATATRTSILSTHLLLLPESLARSLGEPLSPRQRTAIPAIKHRRHVFATTSPTPVALTASEGRRRWPLLWERLGGDPGVVETAGQADATRWAHEAFMPGHERFVGRLGALLAEEEEIGEWEEARRNRARERRLDEMGEEFDSESEDEEEGEEVVDGARGEVRTRLIPAPGGGEGTEEDQEAVTRRFERAILELFVDGLDTLDYDDVDFTPADDPIGERDAEDAWFDDEPPSAGAAPANGTGNGIHSGAKAMENGQGEYDY